MLNLIWAYVWTSETLKRIVPDFPPFPSLKVTATHFTKADLSCLHRPAHCVSLATKTSAKNAKAGWTPPGDRCPSKLRSSLLSAPSRKLRWPRPSFLQELQSRKERENLYVVTETVETLQDTILQSHGQMLGAGQLSLLQMGHVQVGSVPEWVHSGQ